MYNPSRGGVRGGADQFTWETVKTDKHRENYLGHSLMAPVGRWQKGKDLAWYAKERKDGKTPETAIDRSEISSIKKAEEEAMLIALGHNIVRKTQTLTKEDMREALKRNTDRDDHHIERIDGVGAASQRIASLSGVRKDARQNNEGVAFETVREKIISNRNGDKGDEFLHGERKKNKKKSKKHKKEKKHKKHNRESYDSDSSVDSSKYKTKYKQSESDDGIKKSSKVKHSKKSKHKHKDYSSDSDSPDSDARKYSKLQNYETSTSRIRNHANFDSSDDDDERKFQKVKNQKKSNIRYQDYSSGLSASVVEHKTKHKKRQLDSDDKKSSKEKSHKKSKHKHENYSYDMSDERTDYQKKDHKKQMEFVKRHRHDTSESD